MSDSEELAILEGLCEHCKPIMKKRIELLQEGLLARIEQTLEITAKIIDVKKD